MQWKRLLVLFLVIGLIRAADIRPQERPQDATVVPPRETFVPDDVKTAAFVVCGVHGNPDKTNDAIVIVQWERDRKSQYRATISRRPDAHTALEDCREWFGDVQQEFRKSK